MLEPVAWKAGTAVLRGPGRGNAPRLPDEAQFTALREFTLNLNLSLIQRETKDR
ncbi:hypothetical protein [Planotetraspora sp. GP83]|uniref:hypothetical protein n=1 Tax=Planotetraspora sp. GP83 TaxID=3156264 RepID=UPI0035198E1B